MFVLQVPEGAQIGGTTQNNDDCAISGERPEELPNRNTPPFAPPEPQFASKIFLDELPVATLVSPIYEETDRPRLDGNEIVNMLAIGPDYLDIDQPARVQDSAEIRRNAILSPNQGSS